MAEDSCTPFTAAIALTNAVRFPWTIATNAADVAGIGTVYAVEISRSAFSAACTCMRLLFAGSTASASRASHAASLPCQRASTTPALFLTSSNHSLTARSAAPAPLRAIPHKSGLVLERDEGRDARVDRADHAVERRRRRNERIERGLQRHGVGLQLIEARMGRGHLRRPARGRPRPSSPSASFGSAASVGFNARAPRSSARRLATSGATSNAVFLPTTGAV